MKQYMRNGISAVLFLIFSIAPPAYAQGIGCGGGLGPIADLLCNVENNEQGKETVGNEFNKVISRVVGFLTVSAALWFFFQLIMAAYNWISAGGDKTRTEAAWHKITNAIIGLVIVAAAWVIVGLLGTLLGLDILNPGSIISTISP